MTMTLLSSSHPSASLPLGMVNRVSPWLKAELTRAAFPCSMKPCSILHLADHCLGEAGRGLCSSSSPQLKLSQRSQKTALCHIRPQNPIFLNQADMGEDGKYKMPSSVAHNMPDLSWVYLHYPRSELLLKSLC